MENLPVIIAAFLLAGLVKGVIGFGFPIVALIFLTLSSSLFDALAVIVVPTLATNAWQALAGPYLREILARLWIYILCMCAGILLTSRFLTIVDIDLLTGLLGGILMVSAVSRLASLRFRIRHEREAVLSVALGLLNGIITGLTGTFMVPSVIYFQSLGFGKDELIQALGVFFALSTSMLVVSLGRNQLLRMDDALVSTLALIPSFAGIAAGRALRKKIDERHFQKIFLVAVFLLGAYIIYRANAGVD